MRIDKNGTEVDAVGTVRTDATQGSPTSQARRAERAEQAPASDHVQLSPGAALASQAIKAAEASPDIRPDVVARARALLDAGELGADPLRLADALIDKTIQKD